MRYVTPFSAVGCGTSRGFPHLAAVCLLLAAPPQPLSGSFPNDVPSGQAIVTWERVTGQGQSDQGQVVYEMYVNPLRPALYEITRFRVFPEAQTGSTAPVASNEILVWHARPGRRQPALCFERVSRRDWSRLWLTRQWIWRPVEPGSERYLDLMLQTTGVYMLHRVNLGLDPPRSR